MVFCRNIFKRIFGKLKIRNSDIDLFVVKSKHNIQNNPKGIVSISLFGNGKGKHFTQHYFEPLLKSCNCLQKVLPGWISRIYLDPRLEKICLEKLLKTNAEIYIMKFPSNKYSGALWRFLPAENKIPFITRDADMPVNVVNDVTLPIVPNAIKNWNNSGKPFLQLFIGIVNYAIPISAGMWGAKPINGKAPIPNIRKLMNKYICDEFGSDECFLSNEIFPLFKLHGYYIESNRLRNTVRTLFLLLFFFILVYFASKYYRVNKQKNLN